jgi:hypothetical protein
MSSCDRCEHWTVRKITTYGDGSTIENWRAADGIGKCASLGIETKADFGCNRFIESSGDHVDVSAKTLPPWRYFGMVPCPDCEGKGDGARGHRCAGTGLVRLYDDGYIGDEQTRLHPKEKEFEAPVPRCPSCNGVVAVGWHHCPACGGQLLKEVAETEIVTDEMAGLPGRPAPLFRQTFEKVDPVRFEDDFPETSA